MAASPETAAGGWLEMSTISSEAMLRLPCGSVARVRRRFAPGARGTAGTWNRAEVAGASARTDSSWITCTVVPARALVPESVDDVAGVTG